MKVAIVLHVLETVLILEKHCPRLIIEPVLTNNPLLLEYPPDLDA